MKTPKIYFLFLFFPLTLVSQDKVSKEEVSSGFSTPVDISFDNANNLYVVEKRGTIAMVNADGTKQSTPFLDIRDRVDASQGEEGLLGLAFHPDYENNGFIYVNYTGPNYSRISRFTKEVNNIADPNSEEVILEIGQPFDNHNGGTLRFGPDGYLYIGMGDGGSGGDPGNRSQNKLELLGKMLRIDINGELPYEIPTDNPFADVDDTLDEIWAIGLRNPWKFSFDMMTGDLMIADVGQNSWEEIDLQKASSIGGENYGWKCYEGFNAYDLTGCPAIENLTPPIFVYETDFNKDGCSITGGYVYRGDDIPYLDGRYIYGDFCTGNIWALSQNNCGVWVNEKLLKINNQNLSTFGQNSNGEIFYAELGTGKIFKLKALCDLTSSLEIIEPSCGLSNGQILVTKSSQLAEVTITGGTFEGLGEGDYDLTVSLGGCINKHCISFEVSGDFTYPKLDAPESLTICEGDPITNTITPPLLANFPNLTMDLYLDSIKLESNWNGTYTYEKTGTYKIQFINSDGCATEPIPYFILKVSPKADIFIESIDSTLVATPGFIVYTWYLGTTPIIGETTNILKTVIPGESYYVIGYNIDGCVSFSMKYTVTNTIDFDWIKEQHIGPNPTDNILNIQFLFTTVQQTAISLFSINGKQVFEKKYEKKEGIIETIDMSTMSSGTYILKVTANGESLIKKIVKQ